MVKAAKKAALATKKIFPRTTRAGFTLLEIIIVVGIIAAIVTMAIPKLSGRGAEVRSVVRKIAVLNRELKNRAKLHNATYRLVIHMGEKDLKPHHEFWVERAEGNIINNYDPKNPPRLAEEMSEKELQETPPAFQPDVKVLKKPHVLPSGMTFEHVELSSLSEPVTSGLVYVHYLPTGYADEAAIQIQYDKKLFWTLAIQPLTGRVDIIDEKVRLKDLQGH